MSDEYIKKQKALYAKNLRKNDHIQKRYNVPLKKFLKKRYSHILNEFDKLYNEMDRKYPRRKSLDDCAMFKQWLAEQDMETNIEEEENIEVGEQNREIREKEINDEEQNREIREKEINDEEQNRENTEKEINDEEQNRENTEKEIEEHPSGNSIIEDAFEAISVVEDVEIQRLFEEINNDFIRELGNVYNVID